MSLNPVRNIALLSQPVLTEGLVFGRCGTTDIDISMDWQGNFFVFVELKHISTGLTTGQRIHLEGLVKGLRMGGKDAVAILAKHDTARGEPILARNTLVAAVYMGDHWESYDQSTTLLEYINLLHTEYQRNRHGN
jgi:hypothetical protein